MLASTFRNLLDGQNINYAIIEHPEAYTAQQVAATAHIPGREFAKTVMVKLDGKLTMMVLPAPSKINLACCKKATGAKIAQLASEEDFQDAFPECETGAMPPFGNLFDMDVYIDDGLTDEEDIVFNAGTHTELIKLHYEDFEKLVHPKIAHLTKVH